MPTYYISIICVHGKIISPAAIIRQEILTIIQGMLYNALCASPRRFCTISSKTIT